MSELSLIPETLTMTSREIAELTGKQHKDVLYDIRRMLDELEVHSADFSAEYKDSTGRTLPAFNLPKRETYILITGYSVTMRAKIIDRWQELEAQVKKLQAEAYEKSFDKLDRSMRAIERISTTLDYTSDRIFDVTMNELERLGHSELAESYIKAGRLHVGEEHVAWTKLETLAAKLAKELVKAQKSAKKRQTPFAELSPEEYAAITTEWRKKHLPYSLVTDPAHKGQATQHALTNGSRQRKLTH